VIGHFEQRFVGSRRGSKSGAEADNPDRKLNELRSAAARVTGAEADDHVDPRQLSEIIARSNSFLAELERRHMYEHHPL
jgi:hypothetical protein